VNFSDDGSIDSDYFFVTSPTQRFFLFDFTGPLTTAPKVIRAYSWNSANSDLFIHIKGTNYVATSSGTTLTFKNLVSASESSSTPSPSLSIHKMISYTNPTNNKKYISMASQDGVFRTTRSTLDGLSCLKLRSCSTLIGNCQSLWNVLEVCEGCKNVGDWKLMPTENTAPACATSSCPSKYSLNINRSCQPVSTGRTTCNGIANFYQFSSNNCGTCGANCATCVGPGACSSCSNGFYLSAGTCQNSCTSNSWRPTDLNTQTARCSPPFRSGVVSCTYWSANGGTCLSKCPAGSTARNNVCVQCPDNCM
jgi:hypothetical protein